MATQRLPALNTLEDFLKPNYDFIIVGGGTAGLVVAARLSENPNVQVGVLEAGPAHIGDPMVMTPAAYPQAISNPEYDWLHKSTKQKYGRVFDQPRGKGLGGSSAINYQMYNRGQKSDYDDWAKLGNKGWGFNDLLPYFKKHENFNDPKSYESKNNIPLETTYDMNYHGHSGPIHTSFSTWRLPQEREWIAASTKLGERMGSPLDGWSGDHIGTFHSLSTIDRTGGPMDGTRSYSTTGYLLPNASRANLHVLTDALVSKLEIEGKRIGGVEFLHSGTSHNVKVGKEVIMSAGAFKTPQIIELSGIGNPTILSAAGVEPQITNIRVGENFQDHVVTGIVVEMVEGENSLDMMKEQSNVEEAMKEYLTSRTGPMSSGGSATCFVAYADLATPEEIKAVQKSILEGPDDSRGSLSLEAKKLVADGLGRADDGSIQIVLLPSALDITNCNDQAKLLGGAPLSKGGQGFSIGPCLARPVSVGSVHIKTSDPREDPAIDPAYLTHDADIEVLSKGIEVALKMIKTSPLKEKVKRRIFPDEAIDMGSKEARCKWIRGNHTTEYHPLGTMSMGREGEGAVDDRLRVYGIGGLRVVDACVMPLQVSGNIQSAVYAVAEKGADLIKADWEL